MHLREGDVLGHAEAIDELPSLGRHAPRPLQLSREHQHRLEIVVAAPRLGRVDGASDLNAPLDLGEPGRVGAGPRRPDVVQRVGPQLLQAELLRHLERLLPDADRVLVLLRQHPIARQLAEHPHLGA